MKPFMRRQLCLLSFLTHKIHAFAPPFNSQVARPIPSSRRPLLQPLHSTSKESQTSAVLNEQIQSLQSENALLKSRLKLLQSQNEDLIQQQQHQQHAGERVMAVEQRLILEDFEGEGRPSIDAMGRVVDGWDKQNRRYTEPWDNVKTINGDDLTNSDDTSEEDELGLYSDAMTAPEYEEEDDETASITLQSTSTDDVCEFNEETNKWTSSNSLDECPVEPNISFMDALKSRANWLVGLLALQSCSGFILARNEALLQDHPVIVYFLTMLVGAGGNAGNQASVRVIRGLALGTLNKATQSQFLSREFRMACALSTILSAAGFLRAIAFHTPFPETLAVTCALSLIVFSSICLGAVLPLFLQRLGVDPAHSSTTIQVIMDILGVVLTVFVSTAVLDSPLGKMVMKSLGL